MTKQGTPIAQLMQGNQACAMGAIRAGVNFFAGYPITPSTEIAEILAEKLPKVGGTFMQMEDEIAGMAAVLGASLAGATALTATSGPGFSLKQENLGYGCMAEIPCVIVNVQRGGPSTGLPTAPGQGDVMQSRWGTHGDHPIIVLTPASVPEAYSLTIKAVEFAQRFRTPVILLMDEVIAHMRERVVIENDSSSKAQTPNVKISNIQEFVPFGQGEPHHVTGLVHDEKGFPTGKPETVDRVLTRLFTKLDSHSDELALAETIGAKSADIMLVAYGCTARAAKKAVKELLAEGLSISLFRPITLWPFPEKLFTEASQKANHIIVPELNAGQLKLEIERLTSGKKISSINRYDSELITPQQIVAKVKEVI